MGRITPSFRQLYQRQVEELRRSNGFQNTLLDRENSQALDSLIKEAWSPEGAALSNSGIPCVLDALNLMANVHNKKTSDSLRRRIEELEKRLNDLTKQLGRYEEEAGREDLICALLSDNTANAGTDTRYQRVGKYWKSEAPEIIDPECPVV